MAVQYGIHDYREFKPTLNNPQLQLSTFNPVQILWQAPDFNDVKESLAKAEQADLANRTERVNIANAFAEQRKHIHGDAENLKRFDDRVAKYNEAFENAVKNNYNTYFRLAPELEQLKKDAINDKMIPQMVRIGDEIEEWKNKIRNNKNISPDRANRLIDTVDSESVDNHFTYDNNGNINGGTSWIPTVDVVEDKDDIQMEAELKTFVASNSKAWSTRDSSYNTGENISNSKNNNLKSDTSELTGGNILYKITNQKGGSVEEITDAQWDKAVETYFKLSGNEKILIERIKDKFYKYNQLEKELNSITDKTSSDYLIKKEEYDILNSELFIDGKSTIATAKELMKQNLKNFAYNGSFTKTSNTTDNNTDYLGNPNKSVNQNRTFTYEELKLLYGQNTIKAGPVISAPDNKKFLREKDGTYTLFQ